MRHLLLRPCLQCAYVFLILVGCIRAPPPMQPYASGGVVQSASSNGQVIAGVGGGTDLFTSNGLSASLDGRVKIGKQFDLGLGGSYGASGTPQTWMGRVSPRWYLTPEDAALVTAVEVGLSGGKYQARDVDLLNNQPLHVARAAMGSFDIPFRFGWAITPNLELFGSAGVFLSVAGKDACPTNFNSYVCQNGAFYNVGELNELGFQYTHEVGFTVGLQGNFAFGYSPSIFGFNLSSGLMLTAGWRFGYRGGHPLSSTQPSPADTMPLIEPLPSAP